MRRRNVNVCGLNWTFFERDCYWSESQAALSSFLLKYTVLLKFFAIVRRCFRSKCLWRRLPCMRFVNICFQEYFVIIWNFFSDNIFLYFFWRGGGLWWWWWKFRKNLHSPELMAQKNKMRKLLRWIFPEFVINRLFFDDTSRHDVTRSSTALFTVQHADVCSRCNIRNRIIKKNYKKILRPTVLLVLILLGLEIWKFWKPRKFLYISSACRPLPTYSS